jgi:anaerobic selenocysteine-containing dehydrogenase
MITASTILRNAKTQIIMGGNPAEAHPVSLQHLLEGKELQKANFIVIDPRLTRTAAHATEYVRMRPGTDIPVLYGMMWHILQNGWEDKEFIKQRVYGFDDLRREVEKWIRRSRGASGHSWRTAQARCQDVRHGEAGNADLGHGPDPENRGHRQRAGELHRTADDRQCRQGRHRRQHLPWP